MKTAVLEFLTDSLCEKWNTGLVNTRFKRYYASVTPQAVAVWCRQLGHNVHYATYYGQATPNSLLPDELDVVFMSTHTRASALAYALAKLLRRRNTMTVIGGPHAACFPRDCLRFFDLVVHKCDKTLIADILNGHFERGSVISSGRVLTDIPSVEERKSEIVAASFNRGRPGLLSNVPLLSSVGCPYTCDFCVDWDSTYAVIRKDQLEADLRFVSKHMRGMLLSYHDPNFGVRFEQVLEVIDNIPPEARNPYVAESSLTILRDSRLRRLRDSNCVHVTSGIESWGNYSNKAAVGSKTGEEKLARVVSQFERLYDYLAGLQATFIFGTDTDQGDAPVELTKQFIHRLPFVWPAINIPTPFGRTPLYERYLREGRILTNMPFSMYHTPYLVTTLKNYHPVEFYEKLIDICSAAASVNMLGRRLLSGRNKELSTAHKRALKAFHLLRTLELRQELSLSRRIYHKLATDPQFRAFHEGRSNRLPDFYRQRYFRALGSYAELLSESEIVPDLGPPPTPVSTRTPTVANHWVGETSAHGGSAFSGDLRHPSNGPRQR